MNTFTTVLAPAAATPESSIQAIGTIFHREKLE
jgi:hypothetical protein